MNLLPKQKHKMEINLEWQYHKSTIVNHIGISIDYNISKLESTYKMQVGV